MYTLNPPPPPSTRPPPLLQQQAEQLNKSLPANLHNYYAAIDIIKVSFAERPRVIRRRTVFTVLIYFFLLRLLQTERKEQHFTPGVFTCMKLPEDKQDECNQTSLYEISRNRLRVIEKLGEGNFGMVSVSDPPPLAHDPVTPWTHHTHGAGWLPERAKRDWNVRWYLINNCQFHII